MISVATVGDRRAAGWSGGKRVDFIVLGSILGAILIAAGRACTDLIPRRFPPPSDEQGWLEVRDRRRLVRLLHAAGRLMVILGLGLLVVTAGLILLSASDGTALAVVLALAIGGVLVGAGLLAWYRYQDSTGAIQRRQLDVVRARLGPARNEQKGSTRGARPATAGRPREAGGHPGNPESRDQRDRSGDPRRDEARGAGALRAGSGRDVRPDQGRHEGGLRTTAGVEHRPVAEPRSARDDHAAWRPDANGRPGRQMTEPGRPARRPIGPQPSGSFPRRSGDDRR